MDFSSHLPERVRSLADPQTQSLLKFCQLAIATLQNAQVPRVHSGEPVKDAQVLSIHCPNRFSADQLVRTHAVHTGSGCQTLAPRGRCAL